MERRDDYSARYIGEALPSSIICGLDFGTKHSAIGTLAPGNRYVPIPASNGRALVPSVVSVLPDLTYLVGSAAIEHGLTKPDQVFSNFKRWLGTDKVFNIFGLSLSAEYLTSPDNQIASGQRGEVPWSRDRGALVSIPANFTLLQRSSLRKACRLAGLHVKRLVSEPSAATLVISSDRDETALLVDLGGGTLDISLLECGEGVWEIIAIGGDRELGALTMTMQSTGTSFQLFNRSLANIKLSSPARTYCKSDANAKKLK